MFMFLAGLAVGGDYEIGLKKAVCRRFRQPSE